MADEWEKYAVAEDEWEKYADTTAEPKEQGFFGAVNESALKRGENIADIYTKNVPENDDFIDSVNKAPERLLQTTGQVAGFVNDVAMEGVKSGFKTLTSDDEREFLKSGLNAVGNLVPKGVRNAAQTVVGKVGQAYDWMKEEYPEGIRDVEAVANIAGAVPIVKGAAMVGSSAIKGGVPIAKKTAGYIYPRPTPEQALGQVLQGKPEDIAKGMKAFSAVDTTGTKAYSDLYKKLDDAIPEYSKQVDVELMKDPKAYKLDELVTTQTSQGGEKVVSNYVEKAINHLDELYTKTDNPVKAQEMKELLEKANGSGLTKKEVNDIARLYGSEYKGFNLSTGQPLTSVNKQMYENVRQGLKDVARKGMSGKAKELDETMSSIFNTRRLVEKNAVAANRLKQKMQESGLGGKVGGAIYTALDLATGKTLSGLLAKLMLKDISRIGSQNIVQIEKRLAKNLKTINNEINRIKTIPPKPNLIEKPNVLRDAPSRQPSVPPAMPAYGRPLAMPSQEMSRSRMPDMARQPTVLESEIANEPSIGRKTYPVPREEMMPRRQKPPGDTILTKTQESVQVPNRPLTAMEAQERSVIRGREQGINERGRLNDVNSFLTNQIKGVRGAKQTVKMSEELKRAKAMMDEAQAKAKAEPDIVPEKTVYPKPSENVRQAVKKVVEENGWILDEGNWSPDFGFTMRHPKTGTSLSFTRLSEIPEKIAEFEGR